MPEKRTIWLTHLNAQDPQDGFRRACEQQGWQVEAIPFIDVKATDVSLQEFETKIGRAHSIAFTSPRAVQFLFALLPENLRVQASHLPCYCMSGSTKEYAQAAGFNVQNCQADSAAALAQQMLSLGVQAPVLFPCSEIRRDDLLEVLRTGQIEILELVVYQTAQKRDSSIQEVKETWRKRRPEAVLISSPSAAQVMDQKLKDLDWGKVNLLALGKSTLHALKEAGFSKAEALGKPEPNSLAKILAH